MVIWLCHHIWVWKRRWNSPGWLCGGVQVFLSCSHTSCHPWDHQGQAQSGWAAVCQQGLALPCLPRSWHRLGRSAPSAKWAKECSHSQGAEPPCVSEAIPSWRRALTLLLPHHGEHSWNILSVWVLCISRDMKLERVCQRGKKMVQGTYKEQLRSLGCSCQWCQVINYKSPWVVRGGHQEINSCCQLQHWDVSPRDSGGHVAELLIWSGAGGCLALMESWARWPPKVSASSISVSCWSDYRNLPEPNFPPSRVPSSRDWLNILVLRENIFH